MYELVEAAVSFPIRVVQVAPTQYLCADKTITEINMSAVGEISTSSNLNLTISKSTEVIYTDCWPKRDEMERIRELFLPYQITEGILDRMSDHGLFLPCPPVTRGQEVSVESMNSEKCKVYEAKEFLLHSQNAIMEFLVHENGV